MLDENQKGRLWQRGSSAGLQMTVSKTVEDFGSSNH